MMDIAEATKELLRVSTELAEIDTQEKELSKTYIDLQKTLRVYDNKKRDLRKEIFRLNDILESENVFKDIQEIEGFNTLIEQELLAISKGMDKTDYRKYGDFPRWKDVEEITKEVIEVKKLYPGWILQRVAAGGTYDTMPPQTFYRYTYKTPQGHYMNYGGIEKN